MFVAERIEKDVIFLKKKNNLIGFLAHCLNLDVSSS